MKANILKQSDTATSSKPEWIAPKDVSFYFGISRPFAYKLIQEGKIKSISLRERGKAKGKRLISYDSLSNFCNSLAEEQNQTAV